MPSIKIQYNNEIRRVDTKLLIPNGSLNYNELVTVAQRLFSLSDSKEMKFTYVDDEGDVITVSSNEELIEAITVMDRHGVLRFRFTICGAQSEPIEQSNSCQEEAVHNYVSCDECGMSPIRGNRFKCTVRHDYDLCASCEAHKVQPFPMIKISRPKITSHGHCRKFWGRNVHCKWQDCLRKLASANVQTPPEQSRNFTANYDLNDAEEQVLSMVMKESCSDADAEADSSVTEGDTATASIPPSAPAIAVPISSGEERKDDDFEKVEFEESVPSVHPMIRWAEELQKLNAMGFTDSSRIIKLLEDEEKQGVLPEQVMVRVVAKLLGMPPDSFTT